MNLVVKHIRETEKLIKAIDKVKIANWILKEGYSMKNMFYHLHLE